jgi:Ribonuclease G/E
MSETVEPTLEEIKLGERKFLHDIANDIVVAQGMCTFVVRKVRDSKPLEDKDLDRLEKTLEALNKMTKKLKDRRAVLIGSSDILT